MGDFDIRTADLRAVNSMTKYPSIPTYHALDPRNGGLLDECVPFRGRVFLTEKVDGTNARIISLPDGSWLLGSREELLYARGDLIGNPALGIVAALRPVAERLAPAGRDVIRVHYVELYGGRVTAASKHYTASQRVGWRLFDVAVIEDYADLLAAPPERISAWRDGGGQRFLGEYDLLKSAAVHGLEWVPRLATLEAAELPTEIEKMHALLGERLPRTTVALDGEPGPAEGIVLRSEDRSTIAKARFQDYERTLRRRGGRR
ncbi:RNA ligase family protein [Micromonospora sp. NPDC049559]|uniref:RNA ligase family protein n=1 Tax=Micromonospora sp. NPDC049559 TaxID=3155923 RepID=UPI00341BEB5E